MIIKACNSWNGASHKKFYDQHLEFIYIYILHAMPNLQRYPWNLNLTKNLEDSVRFFCARNVFISASFSIGSCKQALRKLHSQRNENKQFKQKKHWYLIHAWSDKAFKATVVNRALSSLQGGFFEITLTVPLNSSFLKVFT